MPYVIYQITTEKEYGYGGWKDNYVQYFEVVATTESENMALDFIKSLDATNKNIDIEYSYEWAMNLDPEEDKDG